MRKPKTPREAQDFLLLYEEHTKKDLAAKIGVSVRTLRYWRKKSEEIIEKNPIAAGRVRAYDHKAKRLKGKRYVFTGAQSNTYVHKEFFKSLLVFCEHNNAELVIAKVPYNQNQYKKIDEEEWYDPAIRSYVLEDRAYVSDDLVWAGEVNILPTAVNPLSGLDTNTKECSGIFAHSKVRLKSIATHKSEPAKMLYTTGYCTQRNYIQRKAGQKAEFHHVFAGLYVEKDAEGDWFARHLNATDDGDFFDLDKHYTPQGVTEGHTLEAVNWGDIHVEKMPTGVFKSIWGNNSILDTLKPKYQFIHDLTDFEARNHHNRHDPHFLANQHFNRDNNVEKNLLQCTEFLKSIQREDTVTVVVESNHDQAYKKWLADGCVKKDPENARFFHESNAQVYRHIEKGDPGFNVFEWAVRRQADLENTIFLKEDESFLLCPEIGGIECGMHGHRGINGARGSLHTFAKLPVRGNYGHGHSAGIKNGAYMAGSCVLDADYNIGPSSWSISHIFTYPNGKRALITMKNGKWRA